MAISSESIDDQDARHRTLIDMDEAFCYRMLVAVESGLEKVPMIGVDTRPCTRNPRLVTPPLNLKNSSGTGSALGDVAAGRASY